MLCLTMIYLIFVDVLSIFRVFIGFIQYCFDNCIDHDPTTTLQQTTNINKYNYTNITIYVSFEGTFDFDETDIDTVEVCIC